MIMTMMMKTFPRSLIWLKKLNLIWLKIEVIMNIYMHLKSYRQKLLKKDLKSIFCKNNAFVVWEFILQFIFRLMFFVEMMVYFLQTIISYSLMQAIMSENFWIFLSILLGYVFGYFLFYNDLSLNLILFAKLFEIYKRNLN